jgi:hypothetical protein
MSKKKILSEEELMIDYAEMTSLDFLQVEELRRLTGSDYDEKPGALKYGKFDLSDLIGSLFGWKTAQE